jgi:NADPH:quinone reductase-like Zn-dependent oxidoreductase
MIETEAWVLHQGTAGQSEPGRLRLETFAFPDLRTDEVLVEPIYGCWEGNMTHALRRRPVDVCHLRCEKRIVLGNAGVVRAVRVGVQCPNIREGACYVLAPLGQVDPWGYPLRIFGYDDVGSVGLLARQTKVRADQLIPVPVGSRFDLAQWAMSSVRLACAWDNWKVAWTCWRSQAPSSWAQPPHVWAWGGGVAVCELQLARQQGCPVTMLASSDTRLRFLERLGIRAVDRRPFGDLAFDELRFQSDSEYRQRYLRAEAKFLETVLRLTEGGRVGIFLDNIGTPVLRATLKALARQGVLSTLGWESGTEIRLSRPVECIRRHVHVHTHGARLDDAADAIRHAESAGWMPPLDETPCPWDCLGELADRCVRGSVESYFPVFQVNPP